jgi:ABC-2 type transport system permease protein
MLQENMPPQKVITMNKVIIIAKKEGKDILRSKTFVYMLAILGFLTIVSLSVSFLVFNNQLSEYQKALEILKQIGKIPDYTFPLLFPLNLLRGVVDYIEIIGAILGILLGYISISKERNTNALKLLLTRPLTKKDIAYGKILGNALFVFLLMTAIGLIIVLTIYFAGGIVLIGSEIIKVLLFILFSTIYIMLFFMVAFFFSLQQKTISHALIISFIIWLILVLIFPQIGDTMDTDNQVPGGFFKSMNLNRDQEKQVLARFRNYETIRGGIEQLSITKHYERTMFALFGVKKIYNNEPLSNILYDNIGNMAWIFMALIIGFWADYVMLIKNKNYLRG